MLRARYSGRRRRWAWYLSAWSFAGRRRGRPRLPEHTPGMVSSVALTHCAVVLIGPGQDDAERCAACVHDEVTLGRRLTAIRWIRAGCLAPFLAGILTLSSEARRQSSCPTPSRRFSNARCRAARTPACCQLCTRRQQDMTDSEFISAGKYSYGRPVLSTSKMPVNTARLERGGLRSLGLGRASRSKGAITAHRASGTSSLAMSPPRPRAGLVRRS